MTEDVEQPKHYVLEVQSASEVKAAEVEAPEEPEEAEEKNDG